MNPTVRSVQPNPTKKVHFISNLLPLIEAMKRNGTTYQYH